MKFLSNFYVCKAQSLRLNNADDVPGGRTKFLKAKLQKGTISGFKIINCCCFFQKTQDQKLVVFAYLSAFFKMLNSEIVFKERNKHFLLLTLF